MRGSIGHQMTHIFEASGINQIGESKHQARNEARETLEVNGESATSANVASQTGIYSYGTAETYLDKWVECGKYAKEEFGIRNMEELSSEHIRSYLESKIEADVAYSTFQGNAAALEKLESALNMYSDKYDRGNEYSFKSAVSDTRSTASAELARFDGNRAYDDPRALISALTDSNHQLAASVQLESGVRVNEASKITADQLRGIAQDSHTGKSVGQFDFTGKGGKENIGQMAPETYERLVAYIAEHGSFQISADQYREDLKGAAERTDQQYNATHGLRWNFAQDRVQELQEHGCGLLEAKGIVSQEMGHNRVEITDHYLAR